MFSIKNYYHNMFRFIFARSENSIQTIFDDDMYNIMISEMYKLVCILTVLS